MESRKEKIKAYKLAPKTAGMILIRNTANGRFLLGSTLNLHGLLDRHRFMLELGSHHIREMQADWKSFGADAFTFDVLETIEPSDDPAHDPERELEALEEMMVAEYGPIDGRWYNLGGRIRMA